MSSRIRRLWADHQKVSALFTDHPYIRLLSAEGSPPENYLFEFSVTSLVPTQQGSHAPGSPHRVQVYLPVDYPRRPPFCRMLTPVFHPNIDPQKICIGDHWSAGESLSHLIARIGEMLCYQSYNIKSPLNAEAAAWAEQNLASLPLQRIDLTAGF